MQKSLTDFKYLNCQTKVVVFIGTSCYFRQSRCLTAAIPFFGQHRVLSELEVDWRGIDVGWDFSKFLGFISHVCNQPYILLLAKLIHSSTRTQCSSSNPPLPLSPIHTPFNRPPLKNWNLWSAWTTTFDTDVLGQVPTNMAKDQTHATWIDSVGTSHGPWPWRYVVPLPPDTF